MLILGGGAPLEKEWRGHLQEVKVFLPVWAYTRLLELGFISVAAATQCTPLSGASPWCFIQVCCGVLFWSARQQYFGLALVDHLRETLTNRAHLPLIENSVGRQSLGLPSGGHVGCLPDRNTYTIEAKHRRFYLDYSTRSILHNQPPTNH